MTAPALNRRQLLKGAVTAAGAAPAGLALREASVRGSAVIWGASSASSHRGKEPDGVPTMSIDGELTALGVPTEEHGYGGWQSPELLSILSARHPMRPDLSGLGGVLPASGSVIVPALDDVVPSVRSSPIPGMIDGIAVGITRAEGDAPALELTRTIPGDPVEVGTGAGSAWTTALEDEYRGRIQLLWIGSNNLGDSERVIADTAAAFEVDPERSIVLSHWKPWFRRAGTPGYVEADVVNAQYRQQYGDRLFDVDAALWDPRWWRLPAVARTDQAERSDNLERQERGLAPRSLLAKDNMHLNALGNLVLAHALHEKMETLRLI